MEIENRLLNSYRKYIVESSKLGELIKVVPSVPNTLTVFPTIVFRERNASDYALGKTTETTEYIESLIYQIDIYTKDVICNNKKYIARDIINELRKLTSDYFRHLYFNKDADTRGEIMDKSIERRVMTFTGKVNSWNNMII